MNRTFDGEIEMRAAADCRGGGLREFREGARIFEGAEFCTEENEPNEDGGFWESSRFGGDVAGKSQSLVTSAATSDEGGANGRLMREGLMELRCNLLISHFLPSQVLDFPLSPACFRGGAVAEIFNHGWARIDTEGEGRRLRLRVKIMIKKGNGKFKPVVEGSGILRQMRGEKAKTDYVTRWFFAKFHVISGLGDLFFGETAKWSRSRLEWTVFRRNKADANFEFVAEEAGPTGVAK